MFLLFLLVSIGFIAIGLGCCALQPEKFTPLVRWGLYLACWLLTKAWQISRAAAELFAAEQDRAPQRLADPRFLSVGPKGELSGLERLPSVPPLPAMEALAFAGCANLCMYEAGAAYALQRAPNFEAERREGRLNVRGGSSGAFISTGFAAGCDMAEFVRISHREFGLTRTRLGGCIGVYTRSVGKILREALRTVGPEVSGADLKHGLGISVTRFSPWPEHFVVSEFPDEQALMKIVLASCYIPVAYEGIPVLPGVGFCIDGCAVNFLPDAPIVISPNHCHKAEVTPEREYSRQLSFSLLHGQDVLRLFEDGYLDTVRWLEQGSPSKASERANAGGGMTTLLDEAKRLVVELFLPPSWAPKAKQ